ncbi:MAG: J domain-containing protein [Bacteroidetes bacterium]|nr:J domain-containing protein [Bacteroidota bacterium]
MARATFNEVTALESSERIIRSDDDELRRIIEELTEPKAGRRDEKKPPADAKRDNKNDELLRKAAAVLGIATDASPESITAAYRRKIMQVHPDRVTGQSKEFQESARQKTIELNDAYKLFRDVKGF